VGSKTKLRPRRGGLGATQGEAEEGRRIWCFGAEGSSKLRRVVSEVVTSSASTERGDFPEPVGARAMPDVASPSLSEQDHPESTPRYLSEYSKYIIV
jgi:hypothetical protein